MTVAALSIAQWGLPAAARDGLYCGMASICHRRFMGFSAGILAAVIACTASPAFAQAARAKPGPPAKAGPAAKPDPAAVKYWKAVQATCDAAAAKPASDLGKRIAQTALDEFNRFGGHQIDSSGHLFRFGLTEAEHEEDDGGAARASLDQLGWWQVMKYWRSLYGNDAASKLEARGYRDASTANESADAALLRTDAARLLREAEKVSDPEAREILREAALRAAVVDTSWSAAFVSYVVKEAGAQDSAFRFANAHRAYIYDAFATSTAETAKEADGHIYRACPLSATKPRVGDLICNQREATLADANEAAVRERIRTEL